MPTRGRASGLGLRRVNCWRIPEAMDLSLLTGPELNAHPAYEADQDGGPEPNGLVDSALQPPDCGAYIGVALSAKPVVTLLPCFDGRHSLSQRRVRHQNNPRTLIVVEGRVGSWPIHRPL